MGPKKEKKGFQASTQFKPSAATLNAFQMRGAASRRLSPPSGAPHLPPGSRTSSTGNPLTSRRKAGEAGRAASGGGRHVVDKGETTGAEANAAEEAKRPMCWDFQIHGTCKR